MVGIVDFIISNATALSVLVLAYQLWQRKKQFTTEYEDDLTSQYRDIIYEIPVGALLDDSDECGYEGCLKDYYRYIDLTNDQIFHRQEGRVSKSTWENWSKGISTIMDKSNFQEAWKKVHEREPGSFNELQKFLDDEYHDDPRYWEHGIRARIEEIWYRLWNW